MEIRRATPQDLDAVLAIEQQSFPSPWTRQNFLGELANPHSTFLLAGPSPPLPWDLWAYVIFWVIVDEMHLLNLAVHPGRRRQGLARHLLQTALQQAQTRGAAIAWLEVRPSNQAALSLYKSLGFRQITSRPRYYSDTGEDALILSRLFLPV